MLWFLLYTTLCPIPARTLKGFLGYSLTCDVSLTLLEAPVGEEDSRGAGAQKRQVGHELQVVAGAHAVRDRLARDHQRHALRPSLHGMDQAVCQRRSNLCARDK